MRPRSAGALVTALVAAGFLAASLTACGETTTSDADDPRATPSSGSPSPTEASSTPTDSTPSGDDGCPYLTADKVTAALGSPTHETAGSLNACFFDPDGGSNAGPSVMLSRIDVQIHPADYAAQTKALCKGEVTDVDAGDEAFACVMGLGPQGQLYVGRVLVAVAVNGAADDAAGIAAAAALLPEVTIPPDA